MQSLPQAAIEPEGVAPLDFIAACAIDYGLKYATTPAIELAFGVLAPAENAGAGALKIEVDVNGKVGNNRLLSLYVRAILSRALLSG